MAVGQEPAAFPLSASAAQRRGRPRGPDGREGRGASFVRRGGVLLRARRLLRQERPRAPPGKLLARGCGAGVGLMCVHRASHRCCRDTFPGRISGDARRAARPPARLGHHLLGTEVGVAGPPPRIRAHETDTRLGRSFWRPGLGSGDPPPSPRTWWWRGSDISRAATGPELHCAGQHDAHCLGGMAERGADEDPSQREADRGVLPERDMAVSPTLVGRVPFDALLPTRSRAGAADPRASGASGAALHGAFLRLRGPRAVVWSGENPWTRMAGEIAASACAGQPSTRSASSARRRFAMAFPNGRERAPRALAHRAPAALSPEPELGVLEAVVRAVAHVAERRPRSRRRSGRCWAMHRGANAGRGRRGSACARRRAHRGGTPSSSPTGRCARSAACWR